MNTPPSRRRVAVVLGIVAVALAVALALLASRALAVADREAHLQREVIAERLFDDMEQRLSEFIALEDERPFEHWRPTVLAQGSSTLVPSPLAEGPHEPFVVAYFQIDPDATVSNPHTLAADHPAHKPELATRLPGWGGARAATSRTIDVVVPAPVPMAAPKPLPTPKPVAKRTAPVEQRALLEVSQTISRGASNRSQRQEMNQSALPAQIGNFVDPVQMTAPVIQTQQVQLAPEPVEAVVEPPTPQGASVQAPPTAPRVIQVQVPAEPPRAVDVAVSPLSAQVDADGRWLTRQVRVDGRSWVQGMLIDDDLLRAELGARLLPFEDVATLSWSSGEFEHRFAAPFEGLNAALTVHPLDASESPWNYILGLTALVAAIAALGLGAAWRTTTASIALAEERSDFVSAVTHELRSPLTSIRMYAEMLESGMAADPGTAAQYHTVIREEAERLSRLVEDVLTIAGLERSGIAVAAPEALGAVLDRLRASIEPLVAAQNQSMVFDIDDAARTAPVPADALTQVLTNLIDNASKFSVDASDRRLHMAATTSPKGLELRVRDHGPGVTDAVRAQMFDAFFRGERELTRKTRGTGIGLSLVAGIIHELGGTVAADNHPDGGLQVTLVLPRPPGRPR